MGKNGLLILTFTRSPQTGKCRPRVETAAGKRQTRQMSGHNLLRQPTKRLSNAQADALGKRDGSVRVRALTSHQSSSISIPVRSHISVEFVVGSPLVTFQGFFSGFPGFYPSTKAISSNLNSARLEDLLRLMWLPFQVLKVKNNHRS